MKGVGILSVQNRRKKQKMIAQTILSILITLFAIGCLFNMYVIANWFAADTRFPSALGIIPIAVVEGDTVDENGTPLEDVVKPGELLLAFKRDIKDYEVGETVAFGYNGVILIGNIDRIETRNSGMVRFVIEAVSRDEVYQPTANENNLLGEIAVRIPLLGYFFAFVGTLLGRIIFVGLPLLIYLILLIIGIRQEAVDIYYSGGYGEPVYSSSKYAYPFDKVSGAAFLTGIVLSAAAIVCGNNLSRKVDKQQKKQLAVAQASYGVSNQMMMNRPRTIRSTRPVRATRIRAIEPRQVLDLSAEQTNSAED